MRPVQIYAVKQCLTQWQGASFSPDTEAFNLAVTARLGTLAVEFRRAQGAVFRIALYAALADLNANLSAEVNTCGLVVTPGASADIGLYAKAGNPGAGSWVKQADFTLSDGMLAQLRGFLAAATVISGDDVINALSAMQGAISTLQERLASTDF